MANAEKKINVKIPEAVQSGSYSNMMAVTHNREEFVLDFIMITPPQGTVTSRVICSPGHIKRIIATLQDNLDKYEKVHGAVQVAEGLDPQIGFTKQ
jgi:hypothetical protein